MYGPNLWPNYGTIFTKEQALPELVPPQSSCIHGHFLADAFDGLFPNADLITWLRHPVERVVSNYYHFLRQPDMRDHCCRILLQERLGLREFAELDWMQNEATRYLAGKKLDEFLAVGIAELFEDSLAVLAEVLGWDRTPPAFRDNVNPARFDPTYRILSSDYEHILALNRNDHALYEEARERLRGGVRRIRFRAA